MLLLELFDIFPALSKDLALITEYFIKKIGSLKLQIMCKEMPRMQLGALYFIQCHRKIDYYIDIDEIP